MPEFAAPLFLLLLPLPFLWRWISQRAEAQGAAILVPDAVGDRLRSRAGAGAVAMASRNWMPFMIWALLLLALSGPRQLEPTPALPVSGRDLVIALDLSGSMVRDDFSIDDRKVSRLEAVQTVGSAFARRRGGDRVALVVFGTEAYFATPFTFDVEAVAQAIEGATIGISGRATSISDALGIALKRLEVSEAKSRVVILLSDGANNAGATNPRAVARLAADMGVRVHTIAMGPKDLASAPEERGVVDVATLEAMSDLSGGTMFRVKTTQDLETVTAALDELEATAAKGLAAEVYAELWVYPAGLALLGAVLIGWRRDG